MSYPERSMPVLNASLHSDQSPHCYLVETYDPQGRCGFRTWSSSRAFVDRLVGRLGRRGLSVEAFELSPSPRPLALPSAA